MPRCLRPRVPGATIFFTLALAERGGRLLVAEVEALREAVRATRAEGPFRIDAGVVLPDHLHAVWTLPEGDADSATRWRLIKSRFSRELLCGPLRPSHAARSERGIWQRRTWEHHTRDEADRAAQVRYCWRNLAKHGFMERAEDRPYSSVHRAMRDGRFEP